MRLSSALASLMFIGAAACGPSLGAGIAPGTAQGLVAGQEKCTGHEAPQGEHGACVLDMPEGKRACFALTGSKWGKEDPKLFCDKMKAVYAKDGCPDPDKIVSSCMMRCTLPDEAVNVYYYGELAELEAHCHERNGNVMPKK